MATATIEHGKPAGWVAGCREHCCRQAIYAYNRKRNSDVAILGEEEGRRLVDAAGTKRRVQGMILMGWLADEIAAACGWDSAQAVTNLLSRDKVNRATAERVKVVHRKLWTKWLNGDLRHLVDDPMRKRNIEQAEAKGWVPSAAWDEIDDPRARPRGTGSS